MKKMSRREFGLKISSAVAVPLIAYPAAQLVDTVLGKGESASASYEYSETALECALVVIGKIILTYYLKELGINVGNAAIDEKALEKIMKSKKLEACLTSPIEEEFIFRLLPSLLSSSWLMGAVSSLAFAYTHNFRYAVSGEKESGIVFDTEKIPVTQFIGGIFYWYLLKERGFSYAVLGHCQNNTTALVAEFLMDRFGDPV